jgi:SAM-dependent methyltransferase
MTRLLQKNGVQYPIGYVDTLIDKYRHLGVKYPRILMRVGAPNIRKHFRYKEILPRASKLLDYGCGTGDDMRALIHDGYPTNMVTGYDVERDSIQLGFDLYLDKDALQDRFVVAPTFPFPPGSFEIVYSGSVLHVMPNKTAIRSYLENTRNVLAPSGILFGSTLGFKTIPPGSSSPRISLLSEKELQALLEGNNFTNIEIQVTPNEDKERLWFYCQKL